MILWIALSWPAVSVQDQISVLNYIRISMFLLPIREQNVIYETQRPKLRLIDTLWMSSWHPQTQPRWLRQTAYLCTIWLVLRHSPPLSLPRHSPCLISFTLEVGMPICNESMMAARVDFPPILLTIAKRCSFGIVVISLSDDPLISKSAPPQCRPLVLVKVVCNGNDLATYKFDILDDQMLQLIDRPSWRRA